MAARSSAARGTVAKRGASAAAASPRLPSPSAASVSTAAPLAATSAATPSRRAGSQTTSAGSASAEEIGQLVQRVAGVERQIDGAGPDRRQIEHQVGDRLLDLDGDPVAGPHPAPRQQVGHARRLLDQVTVGPAAAVDRLDRPTGRIARLPQQALVEVRRAHCDWLVRAAAINWAAARRRDASVCRRGGLWPLGSSRRTAAAATTSSRSA